MITLRGTRVEAQSTIGCHELNPIARASFGVGTLSAEAVVRYSGGEWAVRGGFNLWPLGSGLPVRVAINPTGVHIEVPGDFEPRVALALRNDRAVATHTVRPQALSVFELA